MANNRHEWPVQGAAKLFYGNPTGRNGQASPTWERENLTTIIPPWPMVLAWDTDVKLGKIRVHTRCASSLERILSAIWESADEQIGVIQGWGMHLYGGAYNYRLTRGGSMLSMHSYGCAIDFDPARNSFGDTTPHFKECDAVLQAFAAEGWRWGGAWRKPDGMHWQAARV